MQMKMDNTIRVLLLANEFTSAHVLMEAEKFQSRQGEGRLQFTQARSQADFLCRIEQSGVDIAVVESPGPEGGWLYEVLDSIRKNSVDLPVIVIGQDGEDVQDSIRFLNQGAADYVTVSDTPRLPFVLERVRREQEMMSCQREVSDGLRRAHEALLGNQKLMAIGRLAASIAHEINNPLESITNLLYLLRNDPGLSPRAGAYVGLAEKEMDRVAQISKQTLNFYRESRSPVRVNPADLLDEVLVLYSRQIEEKRIKVVRQYRSEATVQVFPGEMRQVLSNIVTNAIEASPAGGRLVLRIHQARLWSDERVNGVRIVIGDNGSGISAESRQKLGELFYTTKGQNGTGLGLWVTRAIVKRYGGEIQLYSSTRQGRQGTVFSIFMPTNLRPQRVLHDGGSSSGDGDGGRSRRILGAPARSGTDNSEAGPFMARGFQNQKQTPRAAS